jgi:predicted molibdopterin-dependent oxidoreductase YjgC
MYKTRELKIRTLESGNSVLDVIYRYKDEITNIQSLSVGSSEQMETRKADIEKYCYCGQGCTFCDFCTGLRIPKNNI